MERIGRAIQAPGMKDPVHEILIEWDEAKQQPRIVFLGVKLPGAQRMTNDDIERRLGALRAIMSSRADLPRWLVNAISTESGVLQAMQRQRSETVQRPLDEILPPIDGADRSGWYAMPDGGRIHLNMRGGRR